MSRSDNPGSSTDTGKKGVWKFCTPTKIQFLLFSTCASDKSTRFKSALCEMSDYNVSPFYVLVDTYTHLILRNISCIPPPSYDW